MSVYVKIKKRFSNFQLDVEFEAENEVMALLGASGCGKSVTLKCIAGVLKPDDGIIVVDGVTLFDSKRRINLTPQKRRIGLLFQEYALFPNMTVEQNIMSVLSLRCEKSERRGKFLALSERFYISGLENHYPGNLSGGQRQRVALARIMASCPSVIMLDEPLSALDSYLRWQLEGELSQMFGEFQGTILYVSHNRDEVYRLCGRVCVIDRGRCERARTVKDLFESPDTLASAVLSGCKNYSRAEPAGKNTVRALDWDVSLECEGTVSEDMEYIGVRAHYMSVSSDESADGCGINSFQCLVLRVTQDVFSTIVNVRPLSARLEHGFSTIRIDLPKDEAEPVREGDVIFVKIKPSDIMLLARSGCEPD
jgi:molybdate transport system ATP-binding protein